MNTETRTGHLTFRVINNAAAFFGGDMVSRLLKFFTGLLIVRTMSGEAYGQFSFVYVYLSIFEMFINFGMQALLTREVAQNPNQAPRILGNAILFQSFLCVIVIPATWALITVLKYPVNVQQGVFLASFQLIFTMKLVFDIIYRVQLKILYPTVWNALRSVLSLVFVAVAVFFHPTINAFILAYLISGLVGFVGFTIFTRRFIVMDFRPDFDILKKIVKESVPLLLSGYLTLIYYRTDVFILSKMKTFLDVGYYSVATRVTEALGFISISLLISLYPIFARTFKENRAHFEETILKAFKTFLIVGFPLVIGGSLVAKELTLFLFGDRYLPSAPTLIILLWFTFFTFFGGLLANILLACGKQVMDAWVSFCQALANIGLNLLLIPKYSYNGAAVATVITTVVGIILIGIYAHRSKDIRMPLPWKELAFSVMINIPYFAILMAMKLFMNLPVALFIILSALIYGLLLVLFRVVTWSQIQNYLSHWKKGNTKSSGLGMMGETL